MNTPVITTRGPIEVACPYCLKPAQFLETSEEIYRGRDFGPAYRCAPCAAWCGAHRDSLLPLGRLANGVLRGLKIKVHVAFDPLWRDLRLAYPDAAVLPKWMYKKARSRAYRWLSFHLNIRPEDCHIGSFDEITCHKAILVIESNHADSAKVRTWIKEFDKEPQP